MANDGCAVSGTGPVLAGLRGSGSVGHRAGQDVVPVRLVSTSVDHIALLVQRTRLVDPIGVAVQGGDIGSDLLALGVIPWPAADAVLGIDLVGGQIGAPGLGRGHTSG